MTLTQNEIEALIEALKVQLEYNSANVDREALKALIQKLKGN